MALNTNCYCNNPSYRTGLMKASQEGYSRQWQFRLPSLSSFRGILGTHALLKSQIGYHSLSASIDVSSVVEVAKSRNSKILPPRRSSIVLGILEKAIESSSTTTKRQLYTGIKAVNSMCWLYFLVAIMAVTRPSWKLVTMYVGFSRYTVHRNLTIINGIIMSHYVPVTKLQP